MTTQFLYFDGVDSLLNRNFNLSFVKKNIEIPTLSESYKRFINQLFETDKMGRSQIEIYSCSILLAHLSLVFHKELDTKHLSEREKQLFILMGDYCNGVNYNLLSKAHDPKFIGVIAKGIEAYSDIKVQLLNKSFKIDEALRLLAEMEWTIFKHALEELHYDVSSYMEYKKLFFLEALQREIEEKRKSDSFFLLRNIKTNEIESNKSLEEYIFEYGQSFSETLTK